MSNNKTKKYECELCTEKVIDNYRVICPFCNVEICEKCFQYSLTMEFKNPSCIYCKKKLSLEFVLSNNATKWCEKVFVPFFEDLCLEKEKSFLIDTIPKFKKIIQIRDLKYKINSYPSNKKIENSIIRDLKLKYDDTPKNLKKNSEFTKLYNEKLEKKNLEIALLNVEIDQIEDNSNSKESTKSIYISKCPDEKCRGYVTDKHICDLCNLEICSSCLMIKHESHICNRDDVKSANIIKESSKSCPKCFVPIFKSSGCNQMFCTNCHIVFDWESLKIDNGAVHNAHYFEWITSHNNETLDLEEVACGDIESIYRVLVQKLRRKINNEYYHYQQYMNDDYIQTSRGLNEYVQRMFQLNRIFNGEIINMIRERLIKNNFEDYRIRYLDKNISEKSWKSRIAKDTINNEKYNSIIEVLEMYITVTSDFIRQLAYDKIDISKFISEYDIFRKHFKKSVDDILQIFGGSLDRRIEDIIYNGRYL